MNFDAVLCDLDGVLRRWRPMADLEHVYGIPPGSLADAAFGPARLGPAITGVHTDEQWRAEVEAELRRHTPHAAELVAAWSLDVGELDAEVVDILRLARQDGPVVIVTNATTRLAADAAALGLASHVDGIVNSAELGFAKPDPRVYHAAADLAGVHTEQCLFVDDSATNVAAARELGMSGLHFQGPQGFRDLVSRRRSGRRAGSPTGRTGRWPPGPPS